jgi:trehalose/maltose transport system permease protein
MSDQALAGIASPGSGPQTSTGKELSLQQQRVRSAWLFLAPMLTALVIVSAYPLLRSIYFSFTDTTLTDLYAGKWIGFDNYLNWKVLKSGRILWSGTLADMGWWNAVWNTVRFSVISVAFEATLGMIVALVLNESFKGRGIVRAAILIPWAIPTIVSARMWGWMLNDQFGIINDMMLNLGLITTKIAWTANVDTAMIAVLMVDIWKTTPFMALLCLAGLQMIPRDIYEAAKIDGIHPVKVFFKITLPLVRPALMVAIIFRMLDALRIFDLVYVLTPNSSATKTMSIISRENLIDFNKFAYGSAQSTLLFLMIAVFVVVYIWLGKVDLTGESR